MKIEISEQDRRLIKYYKRTPLYMNHQNTFFIYGGLKFKEEIKEVKTLFGKRKRKNIYMTACTMTFSGDVKDEIFTVTDECIENIFNTYALDSLRKNYIETQTRYENMKQFFKKLNKQEKK